MFVHVRNRYIATSSILDHSMYLTMVGLGSGLSVPLPKCTRT